MASTFDDIWNGLADAVADIREKVVEEPMWGRSLSDNGGDVPEWPQAQEAQADLGSIEQTREVIQPEPGMDI